MFLARKLMRVLPPKPSFISTWDTTGASETVTLPATSASNDFAVDWGDGSGVEDVIAASPSHIYATADTYEITISGTCPVWEFRNAGDKLKIKDVSQWGEIGLVALHGGFYGCANMTVSATDAGDFSAVTDMFRMFRGTTLANPSVANWDISSATDMTEIFLLSAFSDSNYDLLLAAWSLLSVQSGVPFHAGTAQYTEVAARALLTDTPNNWVITDGGPA